MTDFAFGLAAMGNPLASSRLLSDASGHGDADREIGVWFSPEERLPWQRSDEKEHAPERL